MHHFNGPNSKIPHLQLSHPLAGSRRSIAHHKLNPHLLLTTYALRFSAHWLILVNIPRSLEGRKR